MPVIETALTRLVIGAFRAQSNGAEDNLDQA
jgi:hypothetical protein